MPEISVIIATRNGQDRLGNLLAGLKAQKGFAGTWEILVVDNASTDQTRAVAQKGLAGLSGPVGRVLEEPRPGKSRALNTGVMASQGDLLLFLDDDVSLDEDWLYHMARAFKNPETMAAGGRILPLWQGSPPAWFSTGVACFTPLHDLGIEPAPYQPPASLPVGANWAVRKTALEKVGLFDTRLGIFKDRVVGGEEADLCLRMHEAGMGLVYWPSARVYHPIKGEKLGKACLRRRALVQGLSAGQYARKGRASQISILQENLLYLIKKRPAKPGKEKKPGEPGFYYELKAILYLAYVLGLFFRAWPVKKIPLA